MLASHFSKSDESGAPMLNPSDGVFKVTSPFLSWFHTNRDEQQWLVCYNMVYILLWSTRPGLILLEEDYGHHSAPLLHSLKSPAALTFHQKVSTDMTGWIQKDVWLMWARICMNDCSGVLKRWLQLSEPEDLWVVFIHNLSIEENVFIYLCRPEEKKKEICLGWREWIINNKWVPLTEF